MGSGRCEGESVRMSGCKGERMGSRWGGCKRMGNIRWVRIRLCRSGSRRIGTR